MQKKVADVVKRDETRRDETERKRRGEEREKSRGKKRTTKSNQIKRALHMKIEPRFCPGADILSCFFRSLSMLIKT
jgi:hypothetical protein